jgi:xanthine dehydrogenase molybdenum-binding subunit
MAREFRVVGKPLPQKNAFALVTGKAKFSTDEFPQRYLVGKILVTKHAHAIIRDIDTSKAEALPGVKGVLTHKDVLPYRVSTTGVNTATEGVAVLEEKLRFVGDEVAAVAAETEEIADEALKLIEVDYEVLPAVFDPEDALKPGAPKVHDGGNLIEGTSSFAETGDVQQGFTESDIIYENVYDAFPQPVAPPGRLCAIAWWEGDRLYVIDSNQVPYIRQEQLAQWLDIPISKVHVTTKYMGVGMGEGNSYRYIGMAAWLAKNTGETVKMLTDPEYPFCGNPKRRPHARIYLKAGVKDDGTIMALDSKIYWNKGCFCAGGPPPRSTTVWHRGYYDSPNMLDERIGVFTNTPQNGSYRGWGSPPTVFAAECLMDEVANDLGIDPLEYRMQRYAVQRSKIPIQMAADKIGWSSKWSPPASKTGRKRKGLGIASVIGWMSGAGFPHSAATVQLKPDGSAIVAMGFSDIGTGSRGTLCQVAAEVLGLEFDDVSIEWGKTDLPKDTGSFASRVAINGGTAVYNACQDLITRWFEVLAPQVELTPEDLDRNIRDGTIWKTTGEKLMTIPEAAASSLGARGCLLGYGQCSGQFGGEGTHPYSPHFVEVEVDTETGQVDILNYVIVHDCGTALNVAAVEGQVVGGMLVGQGYALTEDVVYDPWTGAVLNANFLEYKLPTTVDMPPLDLTVYQEEPNPDTAFGQRGVGEPATVPPAPAIANAIYNATGARIRDLPITPAKILRALGKA